MVKKILNGLKKENIMSLGIFKSPIVFKNIIQVPLYFLFLKTILKIYFRSHTADGLKGTLGSVL